MHRFFGVAPRRGFGIHAALFAVALLLPRIALAGMGIEDARHLLGRTGFGATVDEIRRYSALSREQAVEQLLAGARREASVLPPEWVGEPLPDMRALRDASPEERRAFQERETRRGFELRGWWLTEMVDTPSPLTERMTLFWHNHFTSSQQKVRAVTLMYRQNALLRRHALGNFAEMLHAASKDGAMLVYLDAASNRRGQPNENFAREVMELFTLGEGNYGEQDIREAARAFTGWSIEPGTGEFLFRRMLHDEGEKTVLGRSGRFDGDAVLDILLAQPATARFISTKLWREFISPQPRGDAQTRELETIADRFRSSGYEIRTALREVFHSRAFWAPENRGTLVKSPADLVAGSLRTLNVEFLDPLPFALVMAGLGQNLFAPPNVRGWPGGDAWINSSTLLARRQFIERLLRSANAPRALVTDTQRALVEGAPRALVTAAPGVLVVGAGGVTARDDLPRVRGLAALGPDGRERLREALADIRFDSASWLQRTGDLPPRSLLVALDPVSGEQAGVTPASAVGATPESGMDRRIDFRVDPRFDSRIDPRQAALNALLLDPVYQLK